MIGAKAGDNMFDIVAKRGLAQVEGVIVDHLHFAEEEVKLITGADHEVVNLGTQRPRCAILQLVLGEIGKFPPFQPCPKFGQPQLLLFEQADDRRHIFQHVQDLGDFGNKRRIGQIIAITAQHFLRDQMPQIGVVQIFR